MGRPLTKAEKIEARRRWRRRQIIKRIIFLLFFITLIVFSVTKIKNCNQKIDINDYKEAGISAEYFEYVEKLIDLANEKKEAKKVLDNIEKFPMDILDLLVSNPETLDFALGYLDEEKDNSKITLTKPGKNEIPLYQQWDERWGYEEYGENIIAINGCGPTCLSMVAVALLEDTSLNPKEISDFSISQGYYDINSGTSWSLMSEGAEKLGLEVNEISLNEEMITNELKKGHPIIASMRPGDFTTTGHFIVLTGIKDGKVSVNDPNNIGRSMKTWYFDDIKGQIKNLWAFS